MPHAYMPILWSLLTVLVACTDSQFGAGAGKTGEDKAQDPASAEEGVGDALGSSADPEETSADAPIMVTGAFLTCVTDPGLPTSVGAVGVGCTVKKDGEKVELTGFDDVAWSLLTPLNIEIPAIFSEAAATSPYSYTADVPVLTLAATRVRLTLTKSGRATELFSVIASDAVDVVAVDSDAASGASEKVLGQNGDFQLGDDEFDPHLHRGCNARLESVSLRGAGIVIPVTVKSAEATLAVSLKDMCGVTFYNANEITLKSTTKSYATAKIPRSSEFALTGVKLPAGEYRLKVISHMTSKGRDDFVVGGIVFRYEGEIDVGEPERLTATLGE